MTTFASLISEKMKSNDHTYHVEDVNQVEQAAEPVSALLRDDISTIGYDIDETTVY